MWRRRCGSCRCARPVLRRCSGDGGTAAVASVERACVPTCNRAGRPPGRPSRPLWHCRPEPRAERGGAVSSGPAPGTSTDAVPPHPVATALSTDRYQFRFTASAATYEKFKRAQDLLRHAVPSGDPAEIIDRALSALLEGLEQKKFAATDRPRPAVRSCARLANDSRGGQAGGEGPRSRELCFRGRERPPVRRHRVPRVPSRGAVRARWTGDRGQHPASMSSAQRLRGRAGLRTAGTRPGTSSASAGKGSIG